MRIVVFDTETTSIEKPFAYNIGYTIWDTDSGKALFKGDYVVEQVWHNRELFTTAYYSDKRDLYISRMRGKTVELDKIGHITSQMRRVFKLYNVECGFAYNSPFDDRVFTFNCDWFKIINPFDTIPIYDIRGYVHKYIAFTKDFQNFCEKHKYFTESGNYSTTAETVYRYIKNDTSFIEEHTALADSEIELEILLHCIKLGAEWGKDYKVYRSIPRTIDKTLEIKDIDGNLVQLPYNHILIRKEKNNKTRIYLKKKVDKQP